jgi:hypothetical protein
MKVVAHVPVQQYGFIEIEGDDNELDKIEALYNQYAEKPIDFGKQAPVESTQLITLTSPLCSGEVLFDEKNHVYYKDGHTLLSGSAFAERYTPKFNKDVILPKFAAKHGVEASEIAEMWDMKGKVATTFGTALHQALEFYGKHKKTIDATQGIFEIHPSVQTAVLEFFKGREKEQALYEPFIFRETNCGFIDRLLIVDKEKKIAVIEDYKTNSDLHKGSGKMLTPFDKMKNEPLSTYQLQLSFYAHIMKKLGWTIPKLTIHHFTGTWQAIDLEVINLEGVL